MFYEVLMEKRANSSRAKQRDLPDDESYGEIPTLQRAAIGLGGQAAALGPAVAYYLGGSGPIDRRAMISQGMFGVGAGLGAQSHDARTPLAQRATTLAGGIAGAYVDPLYGPVPGALAGDYIGRKAFKRKTISER